MCSRVFDTHVLLVKCGSTNFFSHRSPSIFIDVCLTNVTGLDER